MGQVKQALIEVEDFVNGCLRKGRTLNQTIRDARESQAAKSNPNSSGIEILLELRIDFST